MNYTMASIANESTGPSATVIPEFMPFLQRAKHRPVFLTVDVVAGILKSDVANLCIKTGSQLVAAASTKEQCDAIGAALHIGEPELQRWLNVCDLLRVTRLTLPMAYMLIGLGVRSVRQLATQSPDELYAHVQALKLQSIADRARVGRRLCAIWISSAMTLRPMSYIGD